jgi:hypothetical protein
VRAGYQTFADHGNIVLRSIAAESITNTDST